MDEQVVFTAGGERIRRKGSKLTPDEVADLRLRPAKALMKAPPHGHNRRRSKKPPRTAQLASPVVTYQAGEEPPPLPTPATRDTGNGSRSKETLESLGVALGDGQLEGWTG